MLIGGDDISNDIMPLTIACQCLSTFALVSTSRLLAEIWQLSRRGAKGELEAEFKFQSLVPRPVRAIRVTRGGLEPSPIARGRPRRIFPTSHPKSPRTTGNEAANSRDVVASSPSFSHPVARAPPGQLATKNKIREVDPYRPCSTWA